MIKRLIILVLGFIVTPAIAQWQVPDHSVPVGRGAGITGFKSVGPCLTGVPIVGAGISADPVCSTGGAFTGFANPTATVGLSAVNGAATTAMRSDGSPPLSGTIQSSLTGTNHGVLLGTGTFGFGATAAMSDGQLLVGQSATSPLPKTITGDVTFSAAGASAIGVTKVTSAMLNSDVFSTAHTWSSPQTFSPPVSLGSGGSGQATAPSARGASGFNIDEATATGDANYTILPTDRMVYHTALSAARTDTLPAANSVNPGQVFYITDFRGVASASNTVTLQRAGSDTINGANTTIALNEQYSAGIFWSDGSSRWTFQPITSSGGSGTVTNIVCGSTTITISGTCYTSGQFQNSVNGIATPAVVADGQFITNGSITNGASILTSASNPFVVGDVGKSIACGGTGAAGIVQIGTVSGYTNSGTITVSFTAGATTIATAVCQWGTDNTTVINSAIASLTKGGTVLLPTGYIMVGSINMTNTYGITFAGAANGIGAINWGTILVPISNIATNAMIDTTGSGGWTIRDVQINTLRSPVAPGVGILIASSNTQTATLFRVLNVFAIGTFRTSTIYNFGIEDSVFRDSQLWNYNQTLYGQAGGQLVVALYNNNRFSMVSLYTTINTGTDAIGNQTFDRVEVHDYKPGGGTTSGAAIDTQGLGSLYIYSGQYDSSTVGGILTFEQGTGGVNNGILAMYGTTLYNENGTTAANCLYIPTGLLTLAQADSATSATCTAKHSGTITTATGSWQAF